MKHFTLLLPLLLCVSVLGQEQRRTDIHNTDLGAVPEFGQMTEIALGRKVYVYASDFEARKIIIKELSKEPYFEIADSPESAHFVLLYGLDSEITGASGYGGGSYYEAGKVYRRGWSMSSSSRFWSFSFINRKYIGDMVVLTAGKEDGMGNIRPRIIWTTRKVREYSSGLTFNRHPATNGTREFIKEWKQAIKAAAMVAVVEPPTLGQRLPTAPQNRASPVTGRPTYSNDDLPPLPPIRAKDWQNPTKFDEAVEKRQEQWEVERQRKRICSQNGYRVPCPEDKP
jgi:hypothetical protein